MVWGKKMPLSVVRVVFVARVENLEIKKIFSK
jgi:hypothetical protein